MSAISYFLSLLSKLSAFSGLMLAYLSGEDDEIPVRILIFFGDEKSKQGKVWDIDVPADKPCLLWAG